MSTFQFQSNSEAETARLGRAIAGALEGGIVLAMNGELGSGKTQLTRAICGGLGIDLDHVNSPTFVLLQQYTDGRIPVAHFDTYRLGDVDEFLAIGGEDFLLSQQHVCIVEWADRIGDILPVDHIAINIQQTGETARAIELHGHGERSREIVKRIASGISES